MAAYYEATNLAPEWAELRITLGDLSRRRGRLDVALREFGAAADLLAGLVDDSAADGISRGRRDVILRKFAALGKGPAEPDVTTDAAHRVCT